MNVGEDDLADYNQLEANDYKDELTQSYPDYNDDDQCAFCGETVNRCVCDERIKHMIPEDGETDAERNR